MSIIDDIRNEVKEEASRRNLPEEKAFGYWYLEKYEDLSQEEAENIIIDGPWDRGRDAVYLDEENKVLKIYQFKYSDDLSYVEKALKDVENGIKAEKEQLKNVDAVHLVIVTIASSNSQLTKKKESTEQKIKRWLKENKYNNVEINLEIVDLKRFLELSERLYGVDISLEWKVKNIVDGKAILGLLNAVGLKEVIDDERLISFNIRRFLGIRKGSVGSKIMDTLDNDEKRKEFWILNNGIVCLCTDFQVEGNRVNFKNFTVVNGAQTINAIIKFLDKHPLVEEPIWVVAKVLKVSENEVARATEITEASNTQTPTSARDLRAIDIIHKRIEEWLKNEFNLTYVYKRGQKAAQGSVKMKDLAQAYIAFWKEEPHVSFARPGQIFNNSNYYEDVFPRSEIDRLKVKGAEVERRNFLLRRLLPWKILMKSRDFIHNITSGPSSPYDKKYRSLTYHLVYLYKHLLEERIRGGEISIVYDKIDNILDKTLEPTFKELHKFLYYKEAEIPRCLKTHDIKTELTKVFIPGPSFQEIKEEINKILNKNTS
ncbi:MAG: AIPR family protein [Nitrososphaeria archaeon]